MRLLFFFLLLGCHPKLSLDEYSLLEQDRQNKELELIYLEELYNAQKFEDVDALNFYLKAYLDVPRLKIPDHLKSRPEYFEGGSKIKY